MNQFSASRPANRSPSRTLALAAIVSVFTIGSAYAEQGSYTELTQRSSKGDTTSLNFACNAGNAGSLELEARLKEGPVAVADVLAGIVTKYNGAVSQPLRLVLVRISNDRIVAVGKSEPREMGKGEVIPAAEFGYPKMSGLLPEAELPISSRQLRFVEAHIDAAEFLKALEQRDGRHVLKMLEQPNARDMLLIATISTDAERGADQQYTMHPVVLALE
jgi:hypothetical protein